MTNLIPNFERHETILDRLIAQEGDWLERGLAYIRYKGTRGALVTAEDIRLVLQSRIGKAPPGRWQALLKHAIKKHYLVDSGLVRTTRTKKAKGRKATVYKMMVGEKR